MELLFNKRLSEGQKTGLFLNIYLVKVTIIYIEFDRHFVISNLGLTVH